jgi:hypothetical protein
MSVAGFQYLSLCPWFGCGVWRHAILDNQQSEFIQSCISMGSMTFCVFHQSISNET